jgi:DNA-binding transcriptional MerR regulator
VSLLTLRRWDASGKLRAGRHPCSNYRAYREADVLRLKRLIDVSARAA